MNYKDTYELIQDVINFMMRRSDFAEMNYVDDLVKRINEIAPHVYFKELKWTLENAADAVMHPHETHAWTRILCKLTLLKSLLIPTWKNTLNFPYELSECTKYNNACGDFGYKFYARGGNIFTSHSDKFTGWTEEDLDKGIA